MDRAEIDRYCDMLRSAAIVSTDILPAGSNWVFVVTLVQDGQQIKAVYKPRKGEAPLWDFPNGTLYKREYAAFLVSLELGWDLIPPTVIRTGPYGIGSVQLMIDRPEVIEDLNEVSQGISVFRKVALFDYVTNNADRKAGHFIIDTEMRLWLVDHGLTFNIEPKLRTVLWDFEDEEIPAELVTDLREFQQRLRKDKELRKELLKVLHEKEIAAFERRMRKILTRPVFPGPTSAWSVPWPWY